MSARRAPVDKHGSAAHCGEMAKRTHDTPSLFDAFDDAPDPPAEDVEVDEDWIDVPQARFLSWSVAMQLHYCWRRDLDSALRALSDDDASFYLQRAALYKIDLDEQTHGQR